jgi:hypothetical protein
MSYLHSLPNKNPCSPTFLHLSRTNLGLGSYQVGGPGEPPIFSGPNYVVSFPTKKHGFWGDVEYERQGFIMPMFIPCFDYIIPTLDKVRTCTHFGESQNGPFSTHNRKWDNNMFYMFLITYPRVNERRRGKWPIYGWSSTSLVCGHMIQNGHVPNQHPRFFATQIWEIPSSKPTCPGKSYAVHRDVRVSGDASGWGFS